MNRPTFENQVAHLKALLNWNNIDLEQMAANLNRAEHFAPSTLDDVTFQRVHDDWYELVSRIPLPMIEIDQQYLVRARPNEADELFSQQWEISYNSKFKKAIALGRFNRPTEPVFYATVPTDATQHHLVAGALECCKAITAPRNEYPHHDLTFGIWEVQQPFFVLCLCLDAFHLSTNLRLHGSVVPLLENIRSVVRSDVSAFVERFWEIITAIASKEHPTDRDYFISTALFVAIRNYYARQGQPVTGLMYPSAMTEKHGLNVVLMPETVDRHLSLTKAVMYRWKRCGDGTEYKAFSYSNLAQVTDGSFSFEWTDERECNF